MGLDMYLTRKLYVKNWRHDKGPKHKVILEGPLADHYSSEKVQCIIEECIYWRKANWFHKWFVDNVQGGVDNCGTYYVGQGNLVQLYNLINEVLAHRSTAPEKLPPELGFFFGSDDFDEWYWGSLKETAEELKPIVERIKAGNERGEFYYQSSW